MAHTIYQTDGIILGKSDFGEANRLFRIFTEKFGMISAVAQGVRFAKSKLRHNLDLFSFGNFSLIPIRSSETGLWRIIDAEENTSAEGIAAGAEKLSAFAKNASLLSRMVKGEERNDFIWHELKDFFLFLRVKEKIKNDDIEEKQILFAARVLNNLGYITEPSGSRRLLVSAINKAIKESML